MQNLRDFSGSRILGGSHRYVKVFFGAAVCAGDPEDTAPSRDVADHQRQASTRSLTGSPHQSGHRRSARSRRAVRAQWRPHRQATAADTPQQTRRVQRSSPGLHRLRWPEPIRPARRRPVRHTLERHRRRTIYAGDHASGDARRDTLPGTCHESADLITPALTDEMIVPLSCNRGNTDQARKKFRAPNERTERRVIRLDEPARSASMYASGRGRARRSRAPLGDYPDCGVAIVTGSALQRLG